MIYWLLALCPRLRSSGVYGVLFSTSRWYYLGEVKQANTIDYKKIT